MRAVDTGVDRQNAPGTDGRLDAEDPARRRHGGGTTVTLAALRVPVSGTVVSQPTEIRIANGAPADTLDLVENVGQQDGAGAGARGPRRRHRRRVVVEFPATALAAADTLRLERVDPTTAPGPLPGVAVSPLVAVTLAGGRTTFSGPVTLSLPYPDADQTASSTGQPGGARADPHGVELQHCPPAAGCPSPRRVCSPPSTRCWCPSPSRASMACSRPPMAVRAWRAPVEPAAPAPRSAGAQGSGWQDIGEVTTFPFLVPLNTTTLPNGTYEVRAVCATNAGGLRAAAGSAPRRRRCCGDERRGWGCSLRPGGGWSRATALDAVGISACPSWCCWSWASGSGGGRAEPAVGTRLGRHRAGTPGVVGDLSPVLGAMCRWRPRDRDRTLISRRGGMHGGTDQGGQPVRLVMDLRFPCHPQRGAHVLTAVRESSGRTAATQVIDDILADGLDAIAKARHSPHAPPYRIAASEEPGLHNGLVWPQKLEARLEGILSVQIFAIANMVVDIRHELRLDVRKHQFPHGKVYRNVVLAQMARWALMGRSEQLPIQNPCFGTLFTMAIVSTPGGSPTSRVPSISKLIRITMSGPFCAWVSRVAVAADRGRTRRGAFGLRGGRSVPQDLSRGGTPHGKVAAQRHGTAGDRDLRRDPCDLSSPGPALQLLDAVGVHPETAATTPDVPATG